jgi:hypothetical protein
VADNDKRWQDMSPDEQAVVIRQISGAVNGLQFRVQDLEEAVKALLERGPSEYDRRDDEDRRGIGAMRVVSRRPTISRAPLVRSIRRRR